MTAMKKIPLPHGLFAIVDDDDYQELSKYKWHFNDGYAQRTVTRRKNGIKVNKTIRMHRQILNAPPEKQVDHINRNRLDNRKANLRLCSGYENARNHGLRKDNTSGYVGVTYEKNNKKWVAKIRYRGERKHIGSFDCIHDAAKAYNEAALKYHGEYAFLNKIKTL